MSQAFFEYLNNIATEVDDALEEALTYNARAVGDGMVFDAFATLTRRGGKRMRAAMLGLGFDAVRSGRARTSVRPAMVALELLQTYFLVHDDWMDSDSERRGGPSVHVALGRQLESDTRGAHAAVLAGDWACALAHQQLLECDVAPAALLLSVKWFAQMHRDVVIGQTLDVLPGPIALNTQQSVESVYALKTGAYTVAGPVVLGAALAGFTQLEALAQALRPLGIAFQLRDDWLGAFGDPSRTGKPRGNDLREGKRTPLLMMLASTNLELAQRIADRTASEAQLAEALTILERGARTQLEARTKALASESVRALASLSLEPAALGLLSEAAEWMTQREH
jgi:geranylgeranyl diphosphate synthase, type I